MHSKPTQLLAVLRDQAARIKQLRRSNMKMRAAQALHVSNQSVLRRQLRKENRKLQQQVTQLGSQLENAMQVWGCLPMYTGPRHAHINQCQSSEQCSSAICDMSNLMPDYPN